MAEIPYGFFTPHSPIFALDPNKLALPDEEVSLTGESLSTAFVPPTTKSPRADLLLPQWRLQPCGTRGAAR